MDDVAVKRRKIVAQAAGVVATMCAYTLFLYRRAGRKPPVTYGPLSERDEIRMANLRFIFHNNDRHCVEQLRMRRAPFFHLCTLLRTRRLLTDTINSSIEEQVAMFLQVVGHNCRFRLIELNFRRGLETISRHFHEVLYAIGELRGEMIRPPSHEVHPKIANSRRFDPYFKDCIGAIDGTHVLARVPASMAAAFRGRKGVTTQNVMAAVDFDLKFTFVLAGWEGSAHDATILADALERDDGLRVPPGKFYLVDAGYAVRPGFLPPYRGCRYHLREFGMTDAVKDMAGAVRETVHAEAHPGVYQAVMTLPGFTEDALLDALSWLYNNKAESIGFVQMTGDHRRKWMNRWLTKHYFNT